VTDSNSNVVVIQELRNTQAQLAEMQATMMMWMEEQGKARLAQEKKTPRHQMRLDSLPYGSPN